MRMPKVLSRSSSERRSIPRNAVQLRVGALSGVLGQSGLGRDQFSDQIDQIVEFVGQDADARTCVDGGMLAQAADFLLFGQGRLHLAVTDRSGFGEQLPDRLALDQDAFQGVFGDIVFFDQNLADELVGFFIDALAGS